jgi:hypothetical protein
VEEDEWWLYAACWPDAGPRPRPRLVRTGCGPCPCPVAGAGACPPSRGLAGAEAAKTAPGRGGGGLARPAPNCRHCTGALVVFLVESRGKPAECSNGSEPGQK